jgi:opacity protein-like surface antigen
MKKASLPLLALIACVVAPRADAQDGTAYYGLSIGELDYSEAPFSDATEFTDSVSTWRLMVGYQFMEHLAVEGSYGESSTIRDTATVLAPFPPGSVELGFESEISKMLTIRILGTLPFDNGVSLMAGVGYVDFEQNIVFSVDGDPQLSGEFSDNRPAYYFGVQYDWDRVAVRLGYEKFDFDGEVDAEEIALTFFYRI